jgi:hypothetical protein
LLDDSILAWGTHFQVAYLRLPSGELPAKAFLHALMGTEGTRARARMLFLAQRIADHGRLPWPHGHWLEAPYEVIYEFKPHDFRVMAFRDGAVLRITNAAKKAKSRVQNRDYDVALRMRSEWYAIQKNNTHRREK